jgi:acyl-coenzyme A synthetase/AMP-(fatty) acid ligase
MNVTRDETHLNLKFKKYNMNLTEHLLNCWKKHRHKIAIITPNQEISYLELESYILAAASHLKAQGVKKNAVISMTFSSEVLLAIAIMSTTLIGATALPVPKSATPSQRKLWYQTAGVAYLLSDSNDNPQSEIGTIQLSQGNLITKLSLLTGLIAASPRSPFMIGVGSGSTG